MVMVLNKLVLIEFKKHIKISIIDLIEFIIISKHGLKSFRNFRVNITYNGE
jgi:hypothetical protein